MALTGRLTEATGSGSVRHKTRMTHLQKKHRPYMCIIYDIIIYVYIITIYVRITRLLWGKKVISHQPDNVGWG